MFTDTIPGNNVQLKPAEEHCPYNNWITWFKKLANICIDEYHLKRNVGRKYSAVDHWTILILFAILDLSLDECSDRLNSLLWDVYNRKRRNKVEPKQYKGKYGRKERKCPNGDQVRKYRKTLPKYLIDNLNRSIFLAQIRQAQRQGLFTKQTDMMVDNTDKWCYGSDRFPENPFITKGYNGPGTNRKRKYLAIMLRSGHLNLFVGFDLIEKHHPNHPKILEVIDWLRKEGISIRSVIGDRWFPTFGLLHGLKIRNVAYLGLYKKYAPIKRKLSDYIQNGGDYMFSYQIKGGAKEYYGISPIKVTAIITNYEGRRLREIRADFLDHKLSLTEAMKELTVIITTHHPPRSMRARQGWGVGICERYHRRWQIETGFRDCNRLGPTSNARTNTRQFLMESVKLWVYNAWQLERAKRKCTRKICSSCKQGPTLRRFSFI